MTRRHWMLALGSGVGICLLSGCLRDLSAPPVRAEWPPPSGGTGQAQAEDVSPPRPKSDYQAWQAAPVPAAVGGPPGPVERVHFEGKPPAPEPPERPPAEPPPAARPPDPPVTAAPRRGG